MFQCKQKRLIRGKKTVIDIPCTKYRQQEICLGNLCA